MEKQFKEERLNEFANAIKQFVETYETKGKGVNFFLCIAEKQGDEFEISATVKGCPLDIVSVINRCIKEDDVLRKAELRFMASELLK